MNSFSAIIIQSSGLFSYCYRDISRVFLLFPFMVALGLQLWQKNTYHLNVSETNIPAPNVRAKETTLERADF